MSQPNGTKEKPKAWLDKNNVTVFRGDVTVEEAQELGDMISSAFNAGLLSGYRQGVERAQQWTA
jgi:hypothetical protein